MEGVRNVLLVSFNVMLEDIEETEHLLNSEKLKNVHRGSLKINNMIPVNNKSKSFTEKSRTPLIFLGWYDEDKEETE